MAKRILEAPTVSVPIKDQPLAFSAECRVGWPVGSVLEIMVYLKSNRAALDGAARRKRSYAFQVFLNAYQFICGPLGSLSQPLTLVDTASTKSLNIGTIKPPSSFSMRPILE